MSEELGRLAIVEELGAELVAGFRRRERSRLRRPALRAAALAVAAAVAAGVVLATQPGGGGLSTSQADAAQVLRAAARVAAGRVAPAIPRDAYYYVRLRSTLLLPIRRNPGAPLPRSAFVGPNELVTIEIRRTWNPARGGAIATRVVSVSFPTAAARARWVALGRPSVARELVASGRWIAISPSGSVVAVGGSGNVTLRRLLSLPASTPRVYRVLFAGLRAPDALDLLENISFFPLRPRLQAALYRALALVPGIRDAGRARVLGGRTGIALGARDTGGAVEDEIVIDPQSGQVLGFRTVSLGPRADGLALGVVRAQVVVVERRITRTARPR